MEYRHELADEQWDKLKGYLPGQKGDPGRSAADTGLWEPKP